MLEWKNKILAVLGNKGNKRSPKNQAEIETLQKLSEISKFLRNHVEKYIRLFSNDGPGNLLDLKARLNTIEDIDKELASYPRFMSQSE